MIRILSFSGSPVVKSSTERLLTEIAESCREGLEPEESQHELVRLSGHRFVMCEACGRAPTPDLCFHHEIDDLYESLKAADCVLFGSPIYFDSVSAQAKAFIDRCNCFRPADFEGREPDHDFIKLLDRKRPGAIVLVGSEEGWFEGARRTIAGFFKWLEILNEGQLFFRSTDFHHSGTVADDEEKLQEARKLGLHLAEKIRELRNER